MKKRILTLSLTIIAMMALLTVSVSATTTEVTSGEGFSYDATTKTLTISNDDGYNSAHTASINNLTGVEHLVIEDAVTTMPENKFQNWTTLETVEIGSGLTSIPKIAFTGCSALESVVLGSNVTILWNQAFKDCTSLTSINLDDVTHLYGMALHNCPDLDVTLASSLEFLGADVFSYTAMDELVIPDTVTSCNANAFSYMAGTNIIVNDSNSLAAALYLGSSVELGQALTLTSDVTMSTNVTYHPDYDYPNRTEISLATSEYALTIDSGATLTINDGCTLTIEDGATLTIEDDATLTNNGTILLGSDAVVSSMALSIDGNSMVASAVSYAAGDASIVIESGAIVTNNDTIVVNGTLTVASTASFTNTGDITVTGDFTVASTANVTNDGTLDLSSATSVTISAAITNNDTIIFPDTTTTEEIEDMGMTGSGTVTIDGDAATYDNAGSDISTVDTYAELVAAIDAKVSYITLDGDIDLNAPLTIDYPVTIEGSGCSINGTVSVTDSETYTRTGIVINVTSGEGEVVLKNMTLTNMDNKAVIYVTYSTVSTITPVFENLTINTACRHGIVIEGGNNFEITACTIDASTRTTTTNNAIDVYGEGLEYALTGTISGCDITGADESGSWNSAGVCLWGNTDVEVTGCDFTDCDSSIGQDLCDSSETAPVLSATTNTYTTCNREISTNIPPAGTIYVSDDGTYFYTAEESTYGDTVTVTYDLDTETASFYTSISDAITAIGANTDIVLTDDAIVADVTIPAGVTLTIADGVTLDASAGTITNDGAITNDGTIILPDAATEEDITNLGIAGTGSVTIDGTDYENDGTVIVYPSASTPSTYSSSVASTSNGDVSISASKSASGTKITITADPDNGYVVGDVTVTYASGREVTVTDNGNGTYSYIQPGAAVTVTVTFVDPDAVVEEEDASGFTDVDADAYYYDAMLWAVEKGITTGYSDDTFRPTTACTRGQVVTFLWRAAGSPVVAADAAAAALTDADSDAYYYQAMVWAVENGITTGYADGTFRANDTCTRGQIVTFLFRMDGQDTTDNADPMTDMVDGAYYYDAALWAIDQGITTGYTDGTFQPATLCNRGQIVTFLYRYLG